MTKPNVFIRGIYSTALTKLFLDAGYPIIFPSKKIQERFSIPFRPENSYSKDITIRDRLDRQGLTILFKKAIWDELEKDNFADFPLTQENLPDLILYRARFHKNSIYRGLIVESNRERNFSHIRLIPEEAKLKSASLEKKFQTTLAHYSRYIPDSKEGIFQVTHEDNGRNRASLGSYYTVPGDLIVIVPYNNRIILSKEITNGRKKKHLFDLGKEIQRTKKYGFIFRTAAELARDEEILEEVEKLEQDLIQIQTTITQFPDRIGEIYANYRSLNVIFPKQLKTSLDQIRRRVYPTILSHHTIQSMVSMKYHHRPHQELDRKKRDHPPSERIPAQSLLGYTEELMEDLDGPAQKLVMNKFLDRYYRDFLKTRKSFAILHQKLTGKRLTLTSGTLQSFTNDGHSPITLRIKRWMQPGGLYDGLKTPIERGDYAITELGENNWYYCTTYFSQNNEIKGRYYNINTPIEISSQGAHYIDLEIDVIENMVGERTIIDQDLLDQALQMGIISDEIHGKAMAIAENIIDGQI